MRILLVIAGVIITLFFIRLGVMKGLWLSHMKIEGFHLCSRDWAPMLAWFLLAAMSAGGTWLLI